jgi:hypothetical protein
MALSKEGKKYALAAINDKINRGMKIIAIQKDIISDAEREIRTKKGSTMTVGGIGISTQADPEFAKERIDEAKPKLKKYEKLVKKYEAARDEINKL